MIKRSLLVFTSLITSILGSVSAQNSDSYYYQEIKTDILLPEEAGQRIQSLFKRDNTIFVLTENGLFTQNQDQWSSLLKGSNLRLACMDSQRMIWVLNGAKMVNEKQHALDIPKEINPDSILSLCWDEDVLYIGTTNGLWTKNKAWNKLPLSKGKKIYDILKAGNGEMWIASSNGILKQYKGKWINLDELMMSSAFEQTYYCLSKGINQMDVVFSTPHSVSGIAENGDHWVWTGNEGLPYGPVTSICIQGNNYWMGTAKGATKKDKKWHYYHGKRWLPDNQINDILPIDEHTVWIATNKGVTEIKEVPMTLEEKAEYFEDRIEKRHKRHGLVSRSRLEISGDLSTSKPAITHNEGLWTSIYLASQCFRYAVTNNPEAKKNAEAAFEAMERLEKVTGIPGFPARSLAAYDEEHNTKGEWNKSPDGKWHWLGDSSSDEMIGHFFAYPIFYDLVADDSYKQRSKDLVSRILTHIVENNYRLIDMDGQPTRWGIWNPDSLNVSLGYSIEKGVNSLQMLSFLQAGLYMTGNEKYERAFRELVVNHNYDQNMLYQKMYGPFEMNFVDNQLSFLPYYTLSKYNKDNDFDRILKKSITRSWNIIQKDKIAMWNIIASVMLEKDCDLEVALDELQTIPMDMIRWDTQNSHRWDLQEDVHKDRMDHRQAITPIPADERDITKWNLNVYRFDYDQGGKTENDGAYFLLGYWMGRYNGFFR